jgi:hypothetical protein
VRLTEVHTARALALRYEGRTWTAIAQELGCSREALRQWREREAIDRELASASREAAEAAAGALTLAAGEAVGVLRAVMQDAAAPPSARVSAARTALALAFPRGLPAPEHDPPATPEDAARLLRECYLGSPPRAP